MNSRQPEGEIARIISFLSSRFLRLESRTNTDFSLSCTDTSTQLPASENELFRQLKDVEVLLITDCHLLTRIDLIPPGLVRYLIRNICKKSKAISWS